MPAFSHMPEEPIDKVVAWMLAEGILFEEEGLLRFGRKGEEEFGRKTSWSCFRSFRRHHCSWSGTAARSLGSWTRPHF